MKGFLVKGSFADERAGQQPFSVEVAAEDEKAAREQVVSTFGSKHKVKRWQITIAEVKEVPADQIESHIVKYKLGA